MKVILREDMQNLGQMGDVVKVAAGYARNFLLPKGIAVEANTRNIKALEHEQRIIEERRKKLAAAARSVAEKIGALTLNFKAKAGEEEKLFGSITSMDIAEALNAKGVEVDRKKLRIAEPIKRLGEHTVEVRLGHEITASVKVVVEAEE